MGLCFQSLPCCIKSSFTVLSFYEGSGVRVEAYCLFRMWTRYMKLPHRLKPRPFQRVFGVQNVDELQARCAVAGTAVRCAGAQCLLSAPDLKKNLPALERCFQLLTANMELSSIAIFTWCNGMALTFATRCS